MSTTRMRLLFVSALMAIAMPAAAQTGTIAGKVTSVIGTPVSGAEVRVLSGSQTVSTTRSDENGDFRLPNVAAGTYSVSARLVRYRERVIANVTVSSGFVATVNITLEVFLPVLEQVVTTVSRSPERVVDAPASIAVVNQVEINERPSITVADHVAALPGMDVARGGLMQSNIVARGFNNIFSGS